jgi:hypothetical protein
MRKLKDLLHPGRSAHVARLRLWAHINLRLFAFHSQRHFKGDPRYDLKNVTEGFVPRFDRSSDDTDLLERICRAYARTISRPQPVPACYEPTEWWKDLRQTCLGPVMRALEEGNVGALRVMYSRFFRDRCATGLTGVPYGMLKAYFHGPSATFTDTPAWVMLYTGSIAGFHRPMAVSDCPTWPAQGLVTLVE